MPIKDASGDVVGVAQVINKLGSEQSFTVNDEKVSFPLFVVYQETFSEAFPENIIRVFHSTILTSRSNSDFNCHSI